MKRTTKPDQTVYPPRPSMDGVRRAGGSVAQPQRQPQPQPQRPQPQRPLPKAPTPPLAQASKPTRAVKPRRGHRRLKAFFQWLLAIIVILAVAGAIVYLYLHFYQ